MALTSTHGKPELAPAAAKRTGNTGANAEKLARRLELAKDLQAILTNQLKVGYENDLILLDMAELVERLKQKPASIKNTIRGFLAVIKRTKTSATVEVTWPRGDESDTALDLVNKWVKEHPNFELRDMGGLALVTEVTVGGKTYHIDKEHAGQKIPNLPASQPKNKFYLLKVSNYWAGASSASSSD
jgi:hypothetical protein